MDKALVGPLCWTGRRLSCSVGDMEAAHVRKEERTADKGPVTETRRLSFGQAAAGSFTQTAQVIQPPDSVQWSVRQHTVVVVWPWSVRKGNARFRAWTSLQTSSAPPQPRLHHSSIVTHRPLAKTPRAPSRADHGGARDVGPHGTSPARPGRLWLGGAAWSYWLRGASGLPPRPKSISNPARHRSRRPFLAPPGS